MIEKVKALEDKYNEINERLMQPEVVNDTQQYAALMKEYAALSPIIEKYNEYTGKKLDIKIPDTLRYGEDDKAKKLKLPETVIKTAKEDVEKQTLQAMEGFIHNLNTMHSRAGA